MEEQRLDRAVCLQGFRQLLDSVDVGDNPQVEIELSQGVRFCYPTANAPKIPVRKLAAPE